MAVQRVQLSGSGDVDLEVVGESHYQPTLDRLAGGKSGDAASVECRAALILEDTNPHDDKAVRVTVDGDTVGYLSRQSARFYRAELQRLGLAGCIGECDAEIVGGWLRDASEGSFGIEIDLAPPIERAASEAEATFASASTPLAPPIRTGKRRPQRSLRGLIFFLAILLGLILLIGMCHSGGPPVTGGASGAAAFDYRPLCAAASVDARHLAHVRSIEPSLADPAVIWAGPPPRLQCALMSDGEVWGAVTIDALCTDPTVESCRRVVSVTSLKRGLRYLNKHAPTEEPTASAASR